MSQIVATANAESGIDLIFQGLGIGEETHLRRKAGERFELLAREMQISRGLIVRTYGSASHDEAPVADDKGQTQCVVRVVFVRFRWLRERNAHCACGSRCQRSVARFDREGLP